MMVKPDFKINQLVTIELMNTEDSAEKLSSRIEEVSDNSIHISMPTKSGNLLLLHSGDKINLLFSSNKGVFSASSTVLERVNVPIPVLVVEKPKDYMSVEQKREHVRIDISLPVFYMLEDLEVAKSVEKFIKGITNNVSAGGLFFKTAEYLEKGQKLKLQIHLGDKDIMNCSADVRRIIELNDKGALGIGVQFYDIDERDMDSIYKFIFNKQRDWIQKGLI
ncbi:MAG: flagellar brake protein [Syntrophomonadaceae bacterium]|jgi:c-di-GMP-binding flagellar brake protein YcgR|nr:flagellar brake protein [Syntrophomonadaceae bacterium]